MKKALEFLKFCIEPIRNARISEATTVGFRRMIILITLLIFPFVVSHPVLQAGVLVMNPTPTVEFLFLCVLSIGFVLSFLMVATALLLICFGFFAVLYSPCKKALIVETFDQWVYVTPRERVRQFIYGVISIAIGFLILWLLYFLAKY